MLTVNTTDVDGVRCFWVESGRPTLTALLTFRWGMADESAVRSGWTHLLEHLSLHDHGGGGRLSVNGSVALLETTFSAHGPADLVATHLDTVTGWLASPDLSRLDHERGVLRAETDLRGRGPVQAAMMWRYGARGPGLSALGEPALEAATPEGLAHVARTAFNRSNAVLVLDGPPPAGLTLGLPDGERQPIPPAVPCGDDLPAAYLAPNDGVVLSGVVRRSVAATTVGPLLQRELWRRLRDDAGAAYAPWDTYEPVDLDRAVVLAGSDLSPAARPGSVALARSVVEQMATDGPRPSDLEELIEERLQEYADPRAAIAAAVWEAGSHLCGEEHRGMAGWLEELAAVGVDDVREIAGEVAGSLLVGAAAGADLDGLSELGFPTSTQSPFSGTRYRHRAWPAHRDRLVLLEGGVEVRGAVTHAAPYDDLVAVYAFPDGSRYLQRSDGYGIAVDPAEWHDGESAVAAIDRAAPPGLTLVQPDRGIPAWERPSLHRRWWAATREATSTQGVRTGAGALAVLALVGALVVAAAHGFYLPVAIALGGLVGQWIRSSRERGDNAPASTSSPDWAD